MPLRDLTISRRTVLKGGAAALLGATLPFATAGGRQTRPHPSREERETRTLHFDFSIGHGPLRDLQLWVPRSRSDRSSLIRHSTQSRRRFRARSSTLGLVADEQLTHYATNVDLPAHSLQLLRVTGTTATGEAAVLGLHLHIPRKALRALAKRLTAGRGKPRDPFVAKLRAYGIRSPANQHALMELLEDVNNFSTPYDTATSLAFLHPEVSNNNPTLGAEIINAIQSLPCAGDDPSCEPFLDALTFAVANNWPATTSGGWATLVQQTDIDEQPVFDEHGLPVYRYELDDDVAATAGNVATQIQKAFIIDNPTFAGTNWHPTTGIASVPQTSSSRSLPAAAGFNVEAKHPVGSSLHGVKFVGLKVIDQANRVVQLQIRNEYLRFLTAYVQFFDVAGNALPVESPQPLDTQRAKFLKLVITNGQIMGIPLTGDNISTTSMEFSVPTNASTATVFFGGLGWGEGRSVRKPFPDPASR